MPGGIVLGKGGNASCGSAGEFSIALPGGRASCGPSELCNTLASIATGGLVRRSCAAVKHAHRQDESLLAGELAEEFLLVHTVFESLAAVDEDDRDFVVELAAEFVIGVDVDLAPGETAAPREFAEALFHHFTEVASFAGVDNNIARLWHAKVILRGKIVGFQE